WSGVRIPPWEPICEGLGRNGLAPRAFEYPGGTRQLRSRGRRTDPRKAAAEGALSVTGPHKASARQDVLRTGSVVAGQLPLGLAAIATAVLPSPCSTLRETTCIYRDAELPLRPEQCHCANHNHHRPAPLLLVEGDCEGETRSPEYESHA